MAGPITIHDGELAVKDPADISVYRFDWDAEHLAVGVSVLSPTVFTITEPTAFAAWDAAVEYKFGMGVVELGVIYTALVVDDNLNHAPPNATYWAVTGTVVALTKDQESVLTGNRSTQLRLTGGTVGQTYQIANKIVTSETPAQTKERSFYLLVQDR